VTGRLSTEIVAFSLALGYVVEGPFGQTGMHDRDGETERNNHE